MVEIVFCGVMLAVVIPGLRNCDEIEARTVVFGRLLSISSVFYVGNVDYPRFRRYCRYLM